MLSYLLNMPRERWERPDRPRRVVRVSIAADGADAFARLAFEGEGKDVAAVREALFNRATGVQGATLEEKTTPRHLAVAMDGPAMQPFAPALLTGDALFRPAGAASAEALSRLGEAIAALFADTLPRLPGFEAQARAELIERLRLILAQAKALVQQGEPPEQAGPMLAAAVKAALASAGTDAERVAATLEEVYRFLEITELQAPQQPSQVAAVLRLLEQTLGDGPGFDLPAFVAAMEAQWALPDAPL